MDAKQLSMISKQMVKANIQFPELVAYIQELKQALEEQSNARDEWQLKVDMQAAEIELLRNTIKVYANRGSWTKEAGLRNDARREDIWIFDEPGYAFAEETLKGGE